MTTCDLINFFISKTHEICVLFSLSRKVYDTRLAGLAGDIEELHFEKHLIIL